ncbi:DNA-directed RNA polymerase subunit alpha [Pseudostreptobacillus hongkongensis]|uniref:DNA-directed RNA polymerase subunit alpha n=1 Tax=Pseudostreptobacillus hongkongensis TaxID=1162717 RepID=UPI000831ABD8|nr:DNA-directed RNA polymerase subunit alpha [Pseudostreptobacillus hongkongensis]
MLNIEKIAKNIKLTEEKIDQYSAKYILEPLYRGYGNTVGNALRRILLSSIPGSAIKGVRIEGVLNEFSTIPGVKEAVTDIILNIKEIVVELDEPIERRMKLSVKGPKVVTAGDIAPELGITIINPDQVIATVTTERDLNMEFIVGSGEGFVVSDEINKDGWETDFLAVDAIYTPIRKVSYTVEDTMVGRVTNYDKLTLSITTDGSFEIREALSYAVELLNIYTKPFSDIGSAMAKYRNDEEELVETVEVEVPSAIEEIRIEELALTVRSYNCLKKVNINTVGDLLKLTKEDLKKVKNLGNKSVKEIIEKMKEYGYDMFSSEE